MTGNTILIAGASGIVGRAAVARFNALPGWRVISLSRRAPDLEGPHEHVALDLSDLAACEAASARFAGVTHVVFAALYELPGLVAGWRETAQMEMNLAFLSNLMTPLLRVAKDLRHVTLLQGTKAYGAHIAPMKVPARERWPRHQHANFYWLQEDWLRAARKGRDWRFSILRPQIIFGHGLGSPMNMLAAIGAYGALLKARGEPLHWPGGAPYVASGTCANLLARAIEWAGTSPTAADETFNITNGDVYVWRNLWPAIARSLGMEEGAPRPMKLSDEMPKREAEWAALVQRHGLRPWTLQQFVGDSFVYADWQFAHGRERPGPPVIVSSVKSMQAGFHHVVDTEDMLADWFEEFRRLKLLPPLS